jgi:F0F1-type ATP synthase assembly protein I
MSGPVPSAGAGGGPAAGGGRGSKNRQAQENPGWTIFAYLLSGMAVYGGLGWLVGRWVGNQSIGLAVGMVVGLGLAISLVIFRYGRS